MSKFDKQALLAKEKRLRKELNDASDEVEQQVVKVLGIAVVSGLAAWGLYKLLSPGRPSDDEEEATPETKPKVVRNGSSLIGRLLSAALPLIISEIGLNLRSRTDEQPSEE